jgi:hypothetical protein
VYGRPAKREGCYENIKITKNAHDSHFCAANPKFVAIVTEVAGGGTFLVLPIHSVSELLSLVREPVGQRKYESYALSSTVSREYFWFWE